MSYDEYARELSAALGAAGRSVWAKHDWDSGGWLPLWRHMGDSAGTAAYLWDEWLAPQVRARISEALPRGEADGRRLAVWLAMVHDIGKATPAFACQVEGLAEAMRSQGLKMGSAAQMGKDRSLAPHGMAGQLLLVAWLQDNGWSKRAAQQIGAVVGGHHGVPPSDADLQDALAHRELLYGSASTDAWQRVQRELLDAAASACRIREHLDAWSPVKLPQPSQVLLSALVIVSDWIASNASLYPYFQRTGTAADGRVSRALKQLGLPGRWRPRLPQGSAQDVFAARFSWDEGTRVRPVQEAALAAARAMDEPGMLVIEAPMGEGKTEAALVAAEHMAAVSGAGGCFVALPTMATSNAMFSRLADWAGSLEGIDGSASVFLAHSKAALNDDYTGLPFAGAESADDVERDAAGSRGGGLAAHWWLRGRKKGMLADFAAGTIDQLLFAGLKSRHLALRHLAVAGKVVVIDEAHAYDTYMNTYLDTVLAWLGAYRVPVVVLSATLPARRRRELAEAYCQARRGSPEFDAVEKVQGYPLLTSAVPGGAPQVEAVEASGRRTEVQVEYLDDDPDALARRLETELAGGGCALVVRNTVKRVHATARVLRDRFAGTGVEVSVAHARFVDLDRADKDRELLAAFGPPATVAELGGHRPQNPRIVVASQVAEQSLDIDFDLLVTDLAPVDLVLQRMGRLHRHLRGQGQSERPEGLRTARCLITGADWGQQPPEPDAGSQFVYRRYPLLRAAAALDAHLSAEDGGNTIGGTVVLPDDIDRLVQGAYGPDPIGPSEWQEELGQARESHGIEQAAKADQARAFLLNPPAKPGRSLIGWVNAGVGDTDDSPRGRAQVRNAGESLEVLLLQRRRDGVLTTLSGLGEGRGGIELPTDFAPSEEVGRIAAASAVRLPFPLVAPWVIDRVIDELEQNLLPAWQDKDAHWVAGELLLVLDEDCRTRLAGFDVHYTHQDGLEVTDGH
ncbi:CRISPR-associated helicase Cas3' [Nocardiopsis sp. RSe5-2]|uniref:CRISPR-associated helicase Cas3 n=1 Tax=Nocardiopsis endophytica TaxID=3018445 RepID=A0ABT4TWX3_9ACTN|nr:CRISPR-associated helicase Cas3' [Nocardiopsis endophytica]MDA2809192.1 CRISPR-associated helicase Cas3' [Nocardiopsis endophytica]